MEIDTYVYNANGKLIKQLIQNPGAATYAGDSVIYAYEGGTSLLSSTQYGHGKVWSYAGFSCDASGRPARVTFFDCDTFCTQTGYYGTFYYPKNAVRIPVLSDMQTMKQVRWRQYNNQILVTSDRPDVFITGANLFSLSGALIASVKSGKKQNAALFLPSRPNQICLLAVETNRGRVTYKVNK
jgi:hypothetical protein